jgi:hypothetical protein
LTREKLSKMTNDEIVDRYVPFEDRGELEAMLGMAWQNLRKWCNQKEEKEKIEEFKRWERQRIVAAAECGAIREAVEEALRELEGQCSRKFEELEIGCRSRIAVNNEYWSEKEQDLRSYTEKLKRAVEDERARIDDEIREKENRDKLVAVDERNANGAAKSELEKKLSTIEWEAQIAHRKNLEEANKKLIWEEQWAAGERRRNEESRAKGKCQLLNEFVNGCYSIMAEWREKCWRIDRIKVDVEDMEDVSYGLAHYIEQRQMELIESIEQERMRLAK